MAAPGVLLITTDQQRADTLGAYGSRLGATPRLDALARQGVTFTEARCQHPYCQPSRWTILTGQHPRTHGVWTNGVDPTPENVAAALSTRAAGAGLATAFVGKAHLATNGVFRPGVSPHMEAAWNAARMPEGWYGPYMGFSHVELIQLGHYPFGFGPWPFGLHYGRWLAGVAPDGHTITGRAALLRNSLRRMREAGPARERDLAPQTWRSALPEPLHPTSWIADRAIARLEALGDRPFFLWVSFPDPHHPFDAPEPWASRFDPRDLPLPRRDPAELAGKPPLQRRFSEGLGFWARALNTPAARLPDRDLATMIAAYYGMVAQLDHHIGRILDALSARRLEARTTVAFTSDHGELLGDHGLLFKGPFHYDGLLRVPLVLRGPGLPAGRRVDDPVGTIDLAPTFERILGVPAGGAVEGRDLAPVIEGRERRDAVLTDNDHRFVLREHVQTLTTRDHKLSRHIGRPYGELYVRAEDPGERENRWSDRPALRAELEAELDRRLPPARGPSRRTVSLLPA